MMNDEEQQKLTVMLVEMAGKIEILLGKHTIYRELAKHQLKNNVARRCICCGPFS